jgi:hypothetical protein
MEKQLFQQVIHLYSTRDDVKSYCHGGVWVGPEGIKRLYVFGELMIPLTSSRAFSLGKALQAITDQVTAGCATILWLSTS